VSRVLDELIGLLSLEKIEENLFRGHSQDLGWGRVFGGQVIGQALSATMQTVPADRLVHSLHAYFLLPGDVSRPIVYEVDRVRDGSSFTTRSVSGVQGGKSIFHMAVSFHRGEDGFEHQDEMPDAPEPLAVPTEADRLRAMADRLPAVLIDRATKPMPFEIRPVDVQNDMVSPTALPAGRRVWMKAVDTICDDALIHRALLSWVSDWGFLTTALMPHGVTWLTPGMQVASVDHSMWFHRPFRVDDWLLHVMDSPAASGSRGLVRGRVFDRAGRLVASTAQEGLIRMRTVG
jgi:acyl-CoA thioesterase-2